MVKSIFSNAKKLPAFILYNLIGLGIYLALVLLLNLVTGGGAFTLAGANEWQGWNASDLSKGMVVFLLIGMCVVQLLTFLSFFAVYWFFLVKRERYREEYLRTIGTAKYDFSAERKRYFREEALPEIIFFCAVLLTLFLLDAATKGFPLTVLFAPLTMLSLYIGRVGMFLLDVAGLCAFHWFVVPRLHSKWAATRLRVDNE